MRCFVYRSGRKQDTYLYLPRADDFSDVPDALMQVFGKPETALDFELTSNATLASEDPKQVLSNIEEQGFHLQMPPANKWTI